MASNKFQSPWTQTHAYVHGIAYINTHTWFVHAVVCTQVATMLQSINQFSVMQNILMVKD